MHGVVAVFLWMGFLILFLRISGLRLLTELYRKTKSGMEEAARKRLLTSRSNLTQLQQQEGVWFFLERQLCYSGLKRRFPFLEVEYFLLLSVVSMGVLFTLGCMIGGWILGTLLAGLSILFEIVLMVVGRTLEMRAVNENLMKLLDFLGNYSVTAGEVIGIFAQVSKYMEEPIRSALESCCVEAQTTGDVGMALLSMADKIEHPQFKELVRNIEVSSRYSADFSVLVAFSRRSLREYQKSGRERKSLLREAVINLLLLLGMSLLALVTVNGLLEASVWTILVGTWPGRIAVGIVAGIILLFGMQICRLEG